jgi:peptidyl-prolyl cis-trans isomerase D
MFDVIRKHNRLLMLALVVLILPSFVVFGIQGYSRFTEGGNTSVAKVDGQSVTQAEWDASHREQVERMRQQVPNLDAKVFDSPAARAETLDALIRERVTAAAVSHLHLAVPDARLQRLFVSDPQFAALRNPDGSVNKTVLSAQGMTSEVFAERLRRDLAMQQVQAAITTSGVAPAALTAQALDALLQQRRIRLVRQALPDYLPKAKPGDAEIEAYYKRNEAEFRAPEQAQIEYVVLDLAAIKRDIPVQDEELRKFYTENISRYTAAEERRARHILIKADKDMSEADRQKAKAKAEALLSEVRKTPAAFADLARKHSEDPGSAAQGGDLDFFARGAMVKPFEDAAFALKPGEVSPVVQSDFGYHIIQLDAVRGGEKKPFDAVRAEIADQARQQQATKRWAEATEQFSNMAYEQPDSLQPLIDKFKLDKRSATVQRTPATGATGALASAKLLEAVFGNEAVKNKRNTEAVEVGPNQLASARVVQYQPSRTLPLAEVREAVRLRLQQQQAEDLARKDGEALVARLKANPAAAADLPAPIVVSRAKAESLPRQLLDAVLAADVSKLPAVVGVAVPGRGYAVALIEAVLPREANPEEDKALTQQLSQAWARAEGEAYYQALKLRYKVEKRVDPLATAAAAASAAKP